MLFPRVLLLLPGGLQRGFLINVLHVYLSVVSEMSAQFSANPLINQRTSCGTCASTWTV